MDCTGDTKVWDLAAGELVRLDCSRGTTLRVTRGTLWITLQNDTRDIVLEAVFGTPGKLKAAILLKGEGQPTERLVLVQGDKVEGWLLESLEPRRLVLKKDQESRELVLFRVK